VTAATLQVVVAYLALVGALAVLAALGVRCGSAVKAGVLVGGVLLVIQAGLDLAGWVGGHRPSEPATHVGYLVVSVVLLPLLAGRALLTGEDGAVPDRADFLVVALACTVAVVVAIRLHATWR
jgi:hypothetical protein